MDLVDQVGGGRESEDIDGRRRRSRRSRERILDAVERALRNPDLPITPERVSAEAGVSLSTLIRHFGDLGGVDVAMRERARARVAPYLAAGPVEGGTRERLRELLRRRLAIFEIIGPLQSAALRHPERTGRLRTERRELHEVLDAQLREALASELEGEEGEMIEASLAALLSLEAWLHLRHGRGLDAKRMAALLEDAGLRLLGDRVHDRA